MRCGRFELFGRSCVLFTVTIFICILLRMKTIRVSKEIENNVQMESMKSSPVDTESPLSVRQDNHTSTQNNDGKKNIWFGKLIVISFNYQHKQFKIICAVDDVSFIMLYRIQVKALRRKVIRS